MGEYEYYVIAHYEMDCVSDSSNHVKESVELEVKEVKKLEEVRVYPNPTTGELFVQSSKFKVQSVEIFDIYGRKVLVPTLTVLQSYDLTVLHPGIYFVRANFEGGGSVKKLVKQ